MYDGEKEILPRFRHAVEAFLPSMNKLKKIVIFTKRLIRQKQILLKQI
jgi:hypothetical protein